MAFTAHYNIAVAEKQTMSELSSLQPSIDNSQTLLTDLTSTSKVSRWRLFMWCAAVCAGAIETITKLALIEMKSIADAKNYPTLNWYPDIAKKFQYGDSLALVNGAWTYAVIDTTKQIIYNAVAVEGSGFINLKVTELVGGQQVKLTAPHKTAFVYYVNRKKPSGMRLNVISEDADELQLWLNVDIDNSVLSLTGEDLDNAGVYPVEDAVNYYIGNLPFDGKLELMTLEEYVKNNSKGVVAVYTTQSKARYGTNPFADFSQKYYPNSGYMKIDQYTPLSGTITYSAV